MHKTVCYFGSYSSDYSRNRIIIKGLIHHKIKVLECQSVGIIFKRYAKIIKKFIPIRHSFDSIIVGFPGYYDMPLAFILGKIFRKTIIFDMYVPTYEAYIIDRKIAKPGSIKAKWYYLIDYFSLRLADYIIADTKAHSDYYKNFYGHKNSRIVLTYIGADSQIYKPIKMKKDNDVLFYGSFLPFYGTEYIVKAAKLLPGIKFKFIGDGPNKKRILNLIQRYRIKNITILPFQTPERINIELNKSKINLGIFGDNLKTQLIINNKVYEGLATKVPVITAESNAVKEMFNYKQNLYPIPVNDEIALKNAILFLLNHSSAARKLALKGYIAFSQNFSEKVIVKNLIKLLQK